MSLYAVLFVVLMWMGLWKIPSTRREAESPLAPYRALLGVIFILFGFVFWLLWMGIL